MGARQWVSGINILPEMRVSLLNLHIWLPRDLRRMIYAELIPEDKDVIKFAVFPNLEKSFDSDFSVYCTKNGHLELLKWAIENGCQWNAMTCARAAENGHLEVLQWARANGCPE